MNESKELQNLRKQLEDLSKGSVPINTAFQYNAGIALLKYAKDKGYNNAQQVIRLAVNTFLTKSGYL